jgi:hypothetical protein
MRSPRTRNIIASVLGVLAVLLLVVGTVAVWARVTVTSSERVADLAVDAFDEAEVQAALSDYITNLVFTAVDIDAALTAVLPDQLQSLEPLLAGGARTAVDRGVAVLLAQRETETVFRRLAERAHRAAMRLLQGDGLLDGISVNDGAVTLNLLPLVGRGATRLQDLGLFKDLQIPELTADGDPAEQIAELEEATGRDLPDDFGQLVVYQSDNIANAQASLQSAQQAATFAKRAMWLVIVLSVVLLVAAVLVAANRWRAVFVLGLGVIAAIVVMRGAVERVVAAAPDIAQNPGGQAAIRAMVGGAATSLMRLAAFILLLALVAVLVAMAIRQWRREDIILAVGVVVGALVVILLGLSIWTLLVGLVLAVAVVLVTPRLLRPASTVQVEGSTPAE